VGKAGEQDGRLGDVRSFLGELYGPDLHAKRVDALAGATLGVMAAASLAVAMIGQALAQVRGLVTKQAVKQGGPTAQQQRHRCVGQLRPVGAAPDERSWRRPGGDGLDGFRP
jgi:hypothetical protein